MPDLDAALSIALDLTASLTAADRYDRLLAAVRRVIPCDATALLRLEGDVLVPLAAHGLVPDALGRRFAPADHPRLQAIVAAPEPVVFSPDAALPDPFDGLLALDSSGRLAVHACLGCPLRVDGELVGALTADAADAHAFDAVDRGLLAFIGALAGATMRTSRLIEEIERSDAHARLVARELVRDARRGGSALIGQSDAMARLREEIRVVAASDLAVLITGETGVGKELVARAVHEQSARHDRPLIHVNCAALPETVAESELFGHVRGAFTGATADRPGKFEIAEGGTILLDEVGELPPAVQPKLLRVLQDGELQRVGADRPVHVHVRVIAATNRDLGAEVAAGRFRADLYHRLAVYPIRVPPLRERGADVPLLAGWFCDQHRRRLGLGPVRLESAARRALEAYPWPGNVRELENLLARVVLRAAAAVPRGDVVVVRAADLGPDFAPAGEVPATPAVAPAPAAGRTLREAMDDYERLVIRRALADAGGSWAVAARALGMHRSNLYHRAVRLGLRDAGATPGRRRIRDAT
jgi:anaerobic nitric oxide reductase transcription regulator